jgi:lipopolysaccharide export system permease protein
MTMALTLNLYVSRRFLAAALAMLAALSGLVSLFDFIELLRRAASRPDVTLGLVTEIAGLRLPYISLRLLPFAVMLGGIMAFWRLTRSSELIVARASGVSAWGFLSGPVLCAVMLGAVAVAGISPLSSAMLARAEALDNTYLRSGGGPMALSGGHLWLRQSDRELDPRGVAILHARSVRLQGLTLTTGEISVFRLDGADKLLRRVEASKALLQHGFWVLENARVIRPDQMPEPPRTVLLATDLTVNRVQDSFASPDTLSFWALPDFIALLDRSGFSSIRHRLHFQALLALPLLAGTMVLVAAGFSMRPARRGGVARMIGSGVAAGFALFVVSKLAEEFGQSGALPVALAAWVPAAAGLLLAVALLLHVEDG